MEQETNKPNWVDKIVSAFTHEPLTREQLVNILRQAKERELLEESALSMIEGVMNVEATRVHDVMIPRSHMIIVENSQPLSKIIPMLIESGHSRFPVIGENKDEILGILLAKDLLVFGFDEDARKKYDIKDIMRPATFVPESKRLDKLLQEFRASRSHMAIVVDEYGGVTGLITIEDVLEQIVGDIIDEYDIDEGPMIRKQDENNYIVHATLPLEDFNEQFSSEFTSKDVETIGGLILRDQGRLPKKDEKFEISNIKFKVLRADNRRIHLLQVEIPESYEE